jgi:ubiquitin-conjugating enzyme E2 J2
MATARLRKEMIKLQKEPPPGVIAEPEEKNILRWHYAIRGPSDTAFDGGIYVGKLVFPPEYPMKAPSIYMLTPSGRFQINTKLCMSMSDFHPESWNPLWSVSSIIQGIQSFMASTELTTGGLRSPEPERKGLAKESMAYNKKMFASLFDGDIEAAMVLADKARAEAEEKAAAAQQQASTSSSRNSLGGRKIRTASATKKQDEKPKAEEKDEPKQELSPEEIEKRRKRNAKKRAKQKEKKGAQQSGNEQTENDEQVVDDQ